MGEISTLGKAEGGGHAAALVRVELPVEDEVAKSILKRVLAAGGVQQLWEHLGDDGVLPAFSALTS